MVPAGGRLIGWFRAAGNWERLQKGSWPKGCWMCELVLEMVRDHSHVPRNVWGSKAITPSRHQPLTIRRRVTNRNNRKRLPDCLQGLLSCVHCLPICYLTFIHRYPLFVCSFIRAQLTGWLQILLVLAFILLISLWMIKVQNAFSQCSAQRAAFILELYRER